MPYWVPHYVRLATGSIIVAVTLPFAGLAVGGAVLWDFVDPITPFLCRQFSKLTNPLGAAMVRKKENDFLASVLIMQAVIVPLLFCASLYYTLNHGISLCLAYAYHVFRIGPYFQSFAYAYTLMHKEGHNKLGLFNKGIPLGHVWNWWIGFFYGVMPSNFACGHSLNHHKYDNEENDVITTWDAPRDSFVNYLAYFPRFFAYHLNISVFIQFCIEKQHELAMRMVAGTAFYLTLFMGIFWMHPMFAIVYLIYPLMESALLLSAINWSWHCFVDPDVENMYASSITIFDGPPQTNVLNEDYHVVHHQYPSVHWAEHPRLYEKHKEDYIANQATIFRNTHAMEIFFLAILQQYDVFAEKFVDMSGKLSLEEKKQLIITRLRTCTWGPNADTIQAKAAMAAAKKTKAN